MKITLHFQCNLLKPWPFKILVQGIHIAGGIFQERDSVEVKVSKSLEKRSLYKH